MNGTQKSKNDGRGQSLVEMAVIAPILVLMFIGLMEIGFFLWGYMTILNTDREAARFAVRPGVLDVEYAETGEVIISGYSDIITHTLVVGQGNGNLHLREYLENERVGNDGPKAQVIVTVLGVDTNEPCRPAESCYDHRDELSNWTPRCDPEESYYHDYPNDDIIISPLNNDSTVFVYPVGSDNRSRIDNIAERLTTMKAGNDRLNCEFGVHNNHFWKDDISVTVEIYYEQYQLLGFPLLTWLGDPIPIHVQTTMRVASIKLSEPEE